MLYLASQNSYSSTYTTAELNYAYNKKELGTMIPYNIDGSTLPDQHQLIFSAVNQRNIKEHPIDTILMQDILLLLDKNASVNTTTTQTQIPAAAKPTPTAAAAQPKVSSENLESMFQKGLAYCNNKTILKP